MEKLIAFTAIGFQIFLFLVFLGIIIYLIIRRVEKAREEDFENRDN